MLATAGAIAIHVLVAVFGDALVVKYGHRHPKPAPRIELIDIEPQPLLAPPPPPPPAAQPEVKPPEPKAVEPAQPQKLVRRATPPPEPDKPPPPPSPSSMPPDPNSGGGPVTTMADVAPSATGVAVAKGPPSTGHIGRGGTGAGTGAGSGAGTATAVPMPASIATIKTRAMPHGDFSYWDAGKDYPAEAKSLGIEGVIRVRLIVDEHGKVKSAVLLNKLGHGLDEMALRRAQQIEFDPAKDTNDQPVTSVVVWTFNMELPK